MIIFLLICCGREQASTGACCLTVRFLGTSPMSSNALDLLASVYEQLKAISRGSAVYTEGGEAASVVDEDEAEDEENEQHDADADSKGGEEAGMKTMTKNTTRKHISRATLCRIARGPLRS